MNPVPSSASRRPGQSSSAGESSLSSGGSARRTASASVSRIGSVRYSRSGNDMAAILVFDRPGDRAADTGRRCSLSAGCPAPGLRTRLVAWEHAAIRTPLRARRLGTAGAVGASARHRPHRVHGCRLRRQRPRRPRPRRTGPDAARGVLQRRAAGLPRAASGHLVRSGPSDRLPPAAARALARPRRAGPAVPRPRGIRAGLRLGRLRRRRAGLRDRAWPSRR